MNNSSSGDTIAGDCRLRMADLHAPTTTIYGVLFIMTATVASLGNTVAIIVLWLPGLRSKSNRILTSLAISDALVGYILIPMNAYQMLGSSSLTNCPVDIARAYFTVILCGSSSLTLAVVSYDRYILLTKLNNYDLHMSKKKTLLLLLGAWSIPALTPILRLVGKTPYLIVLIVLFGAPLVILSISYYFITKAIYVQEKTLSAYKNNPPSTKLPAIASGDDDNLNRTADLHGNIFTIDRKDANKKLAAEDLNNTKEEATKRDEQKGQKKHLKLARAVVILIACYFVCLFPLIVWMVLDVINNSYTTPVFNKYSIQNLYLFSIFTASGNSCLNPCIYILKNPDFQRGIRKLLKSKRKDRSVAMSSSMSSDFRICAVAPAGKKTKHTSSY